MYVSPHLKIGTSLVEITPRAMRKARDNLEARYGCHTAIVAGADRCWPSPAPEPCYARNRFPPSGPVGRHGLPAIHAVTLVVSDGWNVYLGSRERVAAVSAGTGIATAEDAEHAGS